LVGNCFRYVVGARIIPTSLNWTDIKAATDMANIKVSSALLNKIKMAEEIILDVVEKGVKE